MTSVYVQMTKPSIAATRIMMVAKEEISLQRGEVELDELEEKKVFD